MWTRRAGENGDPRGVRGHGGDELNSIQHPPPPPPPPYMRTEAILRRNASSGKCSPFLPPVWGRGGRLFSTAKIRRFPEGSARNSICSRITSPRPIYRPFLNEFWVEPSPGPSCARRVPPRINVTRQQRVFSPLCASVVQNNFLRFREKLFLKRTFQQFGVITRRYIYNPFSMVLEGSLEEIFFFKLITIVFWLYISLYLFLWNYIKYGKNNMLN